MTTGNAAPAAPRAAADTRQRYIDATLELITEEGGSLGVNLRAVSRRVGCAHTNAYNYFDSYADLLWAAFNQALRVYGDNVTRGLDVDMPAVDYLRRVIGNLAAFPQENPGLYRFVGSDPIDLGAIPPAVMETVVAMKQWFAAIVNAAAAPGVSPDQAREAADIVLAYIDGETLNLINGRAVPGEDLAARVVANATHLFDLLAGDASTGRRGHHRGSKAPPEPASIFGSGGSVSS